MRPPHVCRQYLNLTMNEITSNHFMDEVLHATSPVLVDFFTPECSPCRRMMPVLEEIESECAGELKMVKVNAGEATELAVRYRIVAVPTFILFCGGQPVAETRGLKAKKDLQQ